MRVRSRVPLDRDVGCRARRTRIAGAKGGRVAVVSGNEVVIVAMSQSQSQSQCRSRNRKVAVEVEVARSQGMRRRKNGVSRKSRRRTDK